jgi:uncharacterized protein YbjT (DUF2867 family)
LSFRIETEEADMILITGSSGTTGRAVLDEAVRAGLPVRAMVRSEPDAAGLPDGVPVVVADFADGASLAAALAGIERVFLVCGPVPDLVALERSMIAACVRAGVRHVVLSSAIGAGRTDKSFPSWHAQVEETLRQSGISHTILRPNGFMQNLPGQYGPSIRAEGRFYAAMGDARTSLIDVRDVGAVAAAILAAPAPHDGAIHELNGPEALSQAEIAARIGAAIGAPVEFVDIPEEAQRAAMLGAGMPEWQVTAILDLLAYYRTGACAVVDGLVARLTGRDARGIDAFLAENAAQFRRGAA